MTATLAAKQTPTGLHVAARSPAPLGACSSRLLACVVALRESALGPQVLLISSAKHESEWIVPKGGWETDETAEQCAKREADEEAGVAGEIVAELGTLDFASHRGLPCRFFGFVMRVAHIYSDWSENSRKRQWVSIEEAKQLLQGRPELLEMVTRATSVL